MTTMTSTAAETAPAPGNVQVGVPNQYHLHGPGVNVSYYPNGFGPLLQGRGPLRFAYHDATQALSFHGDEVRTVEVPDIGTVVSVTIVQTIDTGDTTFSVVIPPVVLPQHPLSVAHIETIGVTTIHRIFVAAIGHPQRATYTTTPLRGIANADPLPL
jgi:hypothetical protein